MNYFINSITITISLLVLFLLCGLIGVLTCVMVNGLIGFLRKRKPEENPETEALTLREYDDKGLDCFSYHEFMDRSSVIYEIICDHLKCHLVYEKYPKLRVEVDKVIERLMDIYQMSSYLAEESERKKRGEQSSLAEGYNRIIDCSLDRGEEK